MPLTMPPTIRARRWSGSTRTPDALARLESLAASLAPLADQGPLPDIEPGNTRAFRRLATPPWYEAWLIVWSPAASLELHDHGGSLGALFLAQGQLVETYTDLLKRHRLRCRIINQGQTAGVPAQRVHEVCNLGRHDAVSVHVYSPPLTRMTFFDHRPRHFLTPLRTQPSDLSQPAVDAA